MLIPLLGKVVPEGNRILRFWINNIVASGDYLSFLCGTVPDGEKQISKMHRLYNIAEIMPK
jgi:hypothetical protein